MSSSSLGRWYTSVGFGNTDQRAWVAFAINPRTGRIFTGGGLQYNNFPVADLKLWMSDDYGATWSDTGSGPFSGVLFFFKDRLWGLGSHVDGASTFPRFSWSTNNGVTWTPTTRYTDIQSFPSSFTPPFLFRNKMWIIMGSDVTAPYNGNRRVYSSTDIEVWRYHGVGGMPLTGSNVVLFQNKVWLIGGWEWGTSTYSNKVYNSDDCINWTLVSTGGFPARAFHVPMAYRGKLYIVGGTANQAVAFDEVWSSPDGITWSAVTLFTPDSAHPPMRWGHKGGVTYDHRAVFVAGRQYTGNGGSTVATHRDYTDVADVTDVIRHSALEGEDLHEVKGIEDGEARAVFVSDGLGSGEFALLPHGQTVATSGTPTPVTITAPTAWAPLTFDINPAHAMALGDTGTFADGPTYTVGSGGDHLVLSYALTLYQTNAAAQDVYVTWRNTGVDQEQYSQRFTLAQNIRQCATSSIMVSSTAGDVWIPVVKCAAGDVVVDNAVVTVRGIAT